MFDVGLRIAQAITPYKAVQQTTASFQTVLQNTKTQTNPPSPEVVKHTQDFIDKYDTAKYDHRFGENVKDGKLDVNELARGLANGAPTSAQNLEDARQTILVFNTPGDTDQALDVNELSVAVVADQNQPAGNDGQSGGPERSDHGGSDGGGGGGSASGSSGAGQPLGIWPLLIQLIDTDGDGKISNKEAKAFADQYGGSIDKAELIKALKQKAAELGQSAPTDAEIEQFFNKADTNTSKDLDITELTALKQPQQDAAA